MSDWSIPTQGPPPAPLEPSDEDALDDIVATCVERGSSELSSRVESACREYPHLAPALRRRIESLREVGLLRDATMALDERFPDRLGEFRLLERLGGGGMGVVFRARQEPLGRDVALKLIRPDQLYFPRARERFQRETEAVARLQHPGIVPIYAVGEEGGLPYFAMELVGGCTLASVLAELRRSAPERLTGSDLQMALQRALPGWANAITEQTGGVFEGSYVNAITRLVIQVADALDHAHARDVLHRDIKPSNIALTPGGRTLLFDFGLASFSNAASRLTATNAEIGSVHYMAPEQFRGDASRVGVRADVYALGVTLYESLALQLPYAEPDLLGTRRAILEGRRDSLRARNRAVSRDLEVVCAKAMELDPALRYATAGEFASDLRNVLEHRPIRARSPSALVVGSRWVRRNPAVSTALVAGLLLPTGVLAALLVQSKRHANELASALADTEAQRKIAIAAEQNATDSLAETQSQRTLAVEAQHEATKQRDVARNEAAESRTINKFFGDMFGWIDPAHAQGHEVTAHELLDVAVLRLETELPDQPLVRANVLDSIGQSYSSLSRWKQAEDALHEALALREQYAGADSFPVAQSLASLAALDHALGRPTALEQAQRAVQLLHTLAPEPSFESADILMIYAVVLQDARRFNEERANLEEVLAMLDSLAGDKRSMRAGVLTNLANVYYGLEQPEQAINAAREAIELQHQVDPRPHPAVTSSLNIIALGLSKLGRYDEALSIYDEVLDEERQLTGEDSERFAAFLAAKATVELAAGRSAAAIELLERASALFARNPGFNENALTCRRNLGLAYERAARWSDALRTSEELVPVLAADDGPGPWQELLNYAQIALCHEALSQWPAAEATLSDALERAAAHASPLDDAWESTLSSMLARYLVRRGDLESAERRLAHARELRSDTEIKIAAHAWSRLAAGELAEAMGDRDRARQELEPLAEMPRGPQWAEWTPFVARAHLGRLLEHDDPEGAKKLATQAAGELRDWLGPEHPETLAAARTLAQLSGH